MDMLEGDLGDRVGRARVAVLATVREDGVVDLVPCTFAFEGDTFVTAVDHKPKTTTNLQRLRNVRCNPQVTLLVDHYDDEDWGRLWWVRIRGRAEVHESGPRWEHAVSLLRARYPQYAQRPPQGAAIVITCTEVTGWSAGPPISP